MSTRVPSDLEALRGLLETIKGGPGVTLHPGSPYMKKMDLHLSNLERSPDWTAIRHRYAFPTPHTAPMVESYVEFTRSDETMLLVLRDQSLYVRPHTSILGGIDIIVGHGQEFGIERERSGTNRGKYIITIRTEGERF